MMADFCFHVDSGLLSRVFLQKVKNVKIFRVDS